MRILILLIGISLSTGCGGDDDPGGNGGDDEPTELAGITAAHNAVRADVGVGPLTWDSSLAAVAQSWVDQCDSGSGVILDHNAGRSDSYPGYVGENIFAGSGPVTGIDAVNSWESEIQYFEYPTTCTAPPGRSCGHYTQVVWADSTKLGCGIGRCQGLNFEYTIVCNYSPGGNDGGAPY